MKTQSFQDLKIQKTNVPGITKRPKVLKVFQTVKHKIPRDKIGTNTNSTYKCLKTKFFSGPGFNPAGFGPGPVTSGVKPRIPFHGPVTSGVKPRAPFYGPITSGVKTPAAKF